jgi:hypothetical protein
MNRFGITVAVLQVLAAIDAAWGREWRQAIIYTTFAVASAAIATQKGG